MLAYGLAVLVGLWSFALYMSAFFLPEVHRRNDIVWSGVGMFYALALWIYGDRISGGLLVAQTAGVLLILWQGWQVLKLRRQLTPESQQTELPNGAKNLDELIGQQTEAIASKVRPATTQTTEPKTAEPESVTATAPSTTVESQTQPQTAPKIADAPPVAESEPACTLEENRAAFDERNGHVTAPSDPTAPPSETPSETASLATDEPTESTPSGPEASTDEPPAPSDIEEPDSTVSEEPDSTVSEATPAEEAQPATANGVKPEPAEQTVTQHHSVDSNGATAQPAQPTQPPVESAKPKQPEAIAPEIIPDSDAPKPPNRDRPASKTRPTAPPKNTKPSAEGKPKSDRPERPRPNIVVLPRRKKGLAGAMARVKGIFGGQSADPQPVKPVNPTSAAQSKPAPQPSKAPSKPDDDLAELNDGWDDWDDDASPQPERPPERSPQVLRAELISPYEDTPPPSPYEEESSV